MQRLEGMEGTNNGKMKQRRHIIQGDANLPHGKMETASFPMSPLHEREYKSSIATYFVSTDGSRGPPGNPSASSVASAPDACTSAATACSSSTTGAASRCLCVDVVGLRRWGASSES
ncbi:hypothetical protein GmHk_15G043888 [Glycine max]|nr:hypothetical protein GmHk_15G043888 [Glycine max]